MTGLHRWLFRLLVVFPTRINVWFLPRWRLTVLIDRFGGRLVIHVGILQLILLAQEAYRQLSFLDLIPIFQSLVNFLVMRLLVEYALLFVHVGLAEGRGPEVASGRYMRFRLSIPKQKVSRFLRSSLESMAILGYLLLEDCSLRHVLLVVCVQYWTVEASQSWRVRRRMVLLLNLARRIAISVQIGWRYHGCREFADGYDLFRSGSVLCGSNGVANRLLVWRDDQLGIDGPCSIWIDQNVTSLLSVLVDTLVFDLILNLISN